MKHIIRQVLPNCMDTSIYFDCDCFDEKSGDWNNTLFIVTRSRNSRYFGLNADTLNDIAHEAESIAYDFNYKEDDETYKSIMEYYDIAYNPTKCHNLKLWADTSYNDDCEMIADYLKIKTGKMWDTAYVTGYSQGDYADIIYCIDSYTKDEAKICGEIWLGCCYEFTVIYLDDEGNEGDEIGGYFVADCQVYRDAGETCKSLVCDYADIDPDETQIQMIDSWNYSIEPIYRFA